MNMHFEAKPPFVVSKKVSNWLLLGVVLVFFQIFIGGVTRLTGSGLSITKWDIVVGTLPPLSQLAWEESFALYQATPQYAKINTGMTLDEFKFIFFWEYFHRLWARLMLFCFLIPFLYFLYKKQIPREMVKNLSLMLVFAGLAAVFGWIMVDSGLKDRPWVSAYKLTIHFSLGLTIFCTLLWVYLKTRLPTFSFTNKSMLVTRMRVLLVVGSLQILLGALMSGMKAGLFFPTWPDMHGELIPSVIFESQYYNLKQFIAYDSNSFVPALVQILHRSTAYLLIILSIWYFFGLRNSEANRPMRLASYGLFFALCLQVLLGILTVLACQGHIPVALGVAHQAGSVFLFSMLITCTYLLSDFSKVENQSSY